MGAGYDVVRYRVVPPLFLVVFTAAVQYLALVAQDKEPTPSIAAQKALGSRFSWGVTAIVTLWAYVWLRVPGAIVHGPPTLFGYQPPYKDNGVLYYWMSLVGFFTAQAIWPELSSRLYTNMPELLGSFNITALFLCAWLLIKGKCFPEHMADKQAKMPILYEFYRGMELHPHIFGVDVKQLTNCRIGMMAWQILIIAFYVTSVQSHGFNTASLVNLLLQSVFVAKFFWWEAGYFSTLDITLDRAGYYICWGCLVWVPILYTYSSYYLVEHPPIISISASLLVALLGIACILLNYRVDYERQLFRRSPDGKCSLWGKPARFMTAEYRDSNGKMQKSRLLLSGCWGVARHLNYTFELIGSLAWCLPGWGHGIHPFLYFFFLLALLVHRTFRDEEKCFQKYGESWKKYCQQVKYRLVPYIF